MYTTSASNQVSVGAGLLAKASPQSILMLTDPPLSRASPLPQGGDVVVSEMDVLGRDHVHPRHGTGQALQVLVVFGDDVFGGLVAVVDGGMCVARQHHVVAQCQG